MSALNSLNNKAGNGPQDNLWYYINGVINSLQDLDVAFSGSYHLALECGNSTAGAKNLVVYSYEHLDTVVDTIRNYLESNSGCDFFEGSTDSADVFTMQCGQDKCIIKVVVAFDYMRLYINQSNKVLSAEFLMADELAMLNVVPVLDEHITTVLFNAISNCKFDKDRVKLLIDCMAGDPKVVIGNLRDLFLKHYSNGACIEEDNKVIYILGFILNILYEY